MKAYLIDEISPSGMEKIRLHMEEHARRSSLEHVYWLEIPADLLSPLQSEHRACQPHVVAVELGGSWVKTELFVRSSTSLHCICPSFSTTPQREFIIDAMDRLLKSLGVRA